ncbi:MAG: dihydrolipoyl dehydrogenase [Aquabacterium sp.]|nr:dihydrolipoyl dehydrogenase [Aquabacterium sp.]
MDISCDVAVLGGGPGGYSAAFRAADLGLDTVIIERYGTLGGVCLNVGCIPSKALLHVASVMSEVSHLTRAGIGYGTPSIDLDALRQHKDQVIGKLNSGLATMAQARKVQTLRGLGEFLDPWHIRVDETTGEGQARTGHSTVLRFKRAIVAVGSKVVRLPFLTVDERIVDSTEALNLPFVPKRMLIIGGGIIGLEMATVYAGLGARIDVVEASSELMPGADRDLVGVWQKVNAARFDHIWVNTKTVDAQATEHGIQVTLAASDGTLSEHLYDLVLCSVGRTPNSGGIGLDRCGLVADERGFIPVDAQRRTQAAHLFAIGDVVGQPMLAHKAVHEGHVAAEVIAGELRDVAHLAQSSFDAQVIPSVAYTDPEIAWVGITEAQARSQGVAVKKGVFPWAASGRAIANGRDEGFTKLLFEVTPDGSVGRILGGGIVGQHAGDLIGEVALAIEMGADAFDIGKTIHPHPTLGESIGLCAEAAQGTCTDLPPARGSKN